MGHRVGTPVNSIPAASAALARDLERARRAVDRFRESTARPRPIVAPVATPGSRDAHRTNRSRMS
jgi:hypothetical protein